MTIMRIFKPIFLIVCLMQFTQCSSWRGEPSTQGVMICGLDNIQVSTARGMERFHSPEAAGQFLKDRNCSEVEVIIGKGVPDTHEAIPVVRAELNRLGIKIVSTTRATGGIDNLLSSTIAPARFPPFLLK